MGNGWFVIELIAILVENFAFVYFLNSRFHSKYNSFWPQLGTWSLLVISCLVFTVPFIVIHAFTIQIIMLIYLLFFKLGTIFQKIFGVLIVFSITIATSLIGAGLASLLTNTSIEHTLIYQDTARLFALIFIKTLQVVVFYALAKRHERERNLRRQPAFFLFIAVAANFMYLIMLRLYVESPNLQPQQNLLVWLAAGSLLIMIAIFIVYELFIREEARNIELAVNLQRTRLETGFLNEMDKLYSAIRTWRHDYENNFTVLRALVREAETDKALDYMDGMNNSIMDSKIMLRTGNLSLDAIVSAKLVLAESHGIKINVEAAYPENDIISDNDLCAIVGNLLDNAIEGCLRITDEKTGKFIIISISTMKKNLSLVIVNSYHEIAKKDGYFLTSKKEPDRGVGIKHIDRIINKYQGYVVRSQDNGIFTTNIIIPLMQPEMNKEKINAK